MRAVGRECKVEDTRIDVTKKEVRVIEGEKKEERVDGRVVCE